jgi:organic radical activating enzyme
MTQQDYKIGRDNFALTIFMPVDCKNGCSFCTSKKDYQVNKPDFTKVFDAISEIGRYDIPFSDIVITGGEPFADITGVTKFLGVLHHLLMKHGLIHSHS